MKEIALLPELMTRHAFSIFCDDIRQESNGKLLAVGMYDDSLVSSEPGAVTVHGLKVYTSFFSPLSNPIQRFRHLVFVGEQILYDFSSENHDSILGVEDLTGEERELGVDTQVIKSVIALPSFTVEATSVLKVRIETESETLRAGALRIIVPRETSSAS